MSIVDIKLNEDQKEGSQAIVSQWLYSVGDFVEKNQPIVELETDKVMMEIIAPISGTLDLINLSTGDEVTGENILGRINTEQKTIKPNKNTKKIKQVNITPVTIDKNNTHTNEAQNFNISPSVRRLSKQHDINLNLISGTGKENRITSRDLQAYISDKLTVKQTTSNKSQLKPISNMRKSIAKHMVDSLLHTAPHVTSVFNLDMSAIIAHRELNKQYFMDTSSKLTLTAYFIAASVSAIKKVPTINSQLHENNLEIFKNINIGIGTALADEGLIVPVIKNCENMNLKQIAQHLSNLTDKARNNKLKPNDVKEGTFTISNHGVSGSLIATPIIINQPQSAILGIGKMEKRVIVKEINGDDVILIKPMCYVTLTIDHRVLDAHQCNQFLSVFVETLEHWK